MGLLNPDSGLVFWVSLSFFIVFFILAKFGFPIIIRSLEERKRFIDESIKGAEYREKRLAQLDDEVRSIIEQVQRERAEILLKASQLRESILSEARDRAQQEAQRITSEALRSAEEERKAILKDAKSQVAMLVIELSERVLRSELKQRDREKELTQKLIEEVDHNLNQEA